MSQRALLLAVASHLQTQLSLTADECDVEILGQPQPYNGELFVAVHAGEWTCREDDGGLDEIFGVQVTVTRRCTYAPEDRHAAAILVHTDADALLKLCETIRTKLHMNYSVINAANTTIGGSADGFVEPLRFRSVSPPRYVGGAWFGSDDGEPMAGIVQTLTFSGARRVQTVESMT